MDSEVAGNYSLYPASDLGFKTLGIMSQTPSERLA